MKKIHYLNGRQDVPIYCFQKRRPTATEAVGIIFDPNLDRQRVCTSQATCINKESVCLLWISNNLIILVMFCVMIWGHGSAMVAGALPGVITSCLIPIIAFWLVSRSLGNIPVIINFTNLCLYHYHFFILLHSMYPSHYFQLACTTCTLNFALTSIHHYLISQ